MRLFSLLLLVFCATAAQAQSPILRALLAGGAANAGPPSATGDYDTVAAMLAATDYSAGDTVTTAGQLTGSDGFGGSFAVVDDGALADGGTVLVPESEWGAEVSVASLGTANEFGEFDIRSLEVTMLGEAIPGFAFHGAGANPSYKPSGAEAAFVSDTRDSLFIPTNYVNDVGNPSATYRPVTGTLRLKRIIPALTLEGVSTTDYVRPEWWDGEAYPDSYTPDTSDPLTSDGDGTYTYTDPTGDGTTDGRYDATDAIGMAFYVAHQRADSTAREHYVVLDGMYGYSRSLETRENVALKGVDDGVRDGNGLRVLRGAPWRRLGLSTVDGGMQTARDGRDWLRYDANASTVLFHGMDIDSLAFSRVVDIELDGNLQENDYIFTSSQYTDPALVGDDATTANNDTESELQNTTNWNGFAGYLAFGNAKHNGGTKLQNVHIHDYGSNLWIGTEPITFEGSRDVRLGNSARNHVMYRVLTGTGNIDGIEAYGFWWLGGFENQQGTYYNLTVSDVAANAYSLGDPDKVLNHRNDSNESVPILGTGYHFGDTMVLDTVALDFSTGFVPGTSWLAHDDASITYKNVTISAPGGTTEPLVFTAPVEKQVDRSAFTLHDLTLATVGGTGEAAVSFLAPEHALDIDLRRIDIPEGYQGSFVFTPLGGEPRQIVKLYDVVFADVVSPSANILFKFGAEDSTSSGTTVYIQDSELGAATDMIQYVSGTGVSSGTVRDSTDIYVQNTVLYDALDNDATLDAGVTYYGDGVTVLQRGSRVGTASGSLSAASLTDNGDGTGYVDVDPGLFNEPLDAGNVTVTGTDAARYNSWTNVGTTEDPVLRLEFDTPGSAVTVDWSASVNPIPGSVTFPG